MSSTLKVDLTMVEANAVAYALTMAMQTEAEDVLRRLPHSTDARALGRITDSAERIGRLAAVARQVGPRTNWSPDHRADRHAAIAAPAAVLLEVVAELHRRAEEVARCGDDEVDGHFEFRQASRTVAAAFADAEAVAA